jgi:hypothetical protein
MMLAETIRRRDVLNWRYRFRSAVTGQYVTRWFALLHPRETMKERVR